MVVLRAPQRSLAHGQTAPVVTGGVIKSPHRLPFARLSAAPSAFGPFSSSFYFFSVFFFFRGDVCLYFTILVLCLYSSIVSSLGVFLSFLPFFASLTFRRSF